MSQCVPSWDIEDNNSPDKFSLRSTHSNYTPTPDVPMTDYEVAELTWENGQLAMHGLGQSRVQPKPITPSISPTTKYTWDKPRASGTLESIVNQATRFPPPPPPRTKPDGCHETLPWLAHYRGTNTLPAMAPATMTMDALVPCSNHSDHGAPCVVGCSTRVGSCSHDEEALLVAKRARQACVPSVTDWNGRDQSASGSVATYGRDNITMTTTNTTGNSQHVTLDTCDRGFTSTSFNGSHDNASAAKPCNNNKTVTVDENDSVGPQREIGEEEEEKKKGNAKSSVSTKRSRAAAIHNQSERKRRDKINQRMKTLQKLVPNSSKTDKASMLDEVIDYLKQLQAQVQMINRMNMQTMMLPMAMQQQQLQMSMMAATPMSMAAAGMGMPPIGMGHHVMDINTFGRPNIPVLHPTTAATFIPMAAASWDGATPAAGGGGGDRFTVPATSILPDPLSAFLACQSQPMTMDAYSRLAAMYQQLLQQYPASSSKN